MLLNTLQTILKNYLDSKKIGINLSASAALTKIASADNSPNNTVGLKFEKINTKNPTITVIAVIRTACPEELIVFISAFLREIFCSSRKRQAI